MLPTALTPLLPSTPVDRFLQRALTGQSEARGAAVWDAGLSATEVMAALQTHRLGPLLCARLPSDAWDSLPDELQAWLKSRGRAQALLDVQQMLALRELLPLAQAQGRPVLLLKGIPMSYRHYPEPHHRVKTDVDVLVRPSDAAGLMALLESLGYTRSLGVTGQLINRQATLARGDVAFDVHWSLSNTAVFAHVLNFDAMWHDRTDLPTLGAGAYAPSDEDLFLHACFHLALHIGYEFALVWLYDIHLLASLWTPDAAERILQRARRLRILRVCLACLQLSRAWFGTPYPDDVGAALARSTGPELSAQILACHLSRWKRLQLELLALS
ncbi:MAG: nucleotidyltransferase family protein, partial [Chloracidobacterium sp.]